MWGKSRLVSVLVLALLVSTAAASVSSVPSVAGEGEGVQRATNPGDFLPQVGVEPEDVLIQIDVKEDGSADWRIEHRVRLDDERTADAFGSVRENITSNPSSYAETFERRMSSTANASETATGRKMAIRDVNVSAERKSLPQDYGVVVYSFEWRGFAESSDVIDTGGVLQGFFLDNRTSLILGWPGGYEPSDVVPEPDERRASSVVWKGPMDFGRNEPRVVVSTPPSLLKTLVGGVVVLSPLAGVAFVVYRRREQEGTETEPGEEPEEDEVAGEETEDAGEEETDLLSNEERVMKELEKNDGRMKQQTLVDSLGWTEAKTSQVVNEMHDKEMIEKYRLGRENVLAMPEEEEGEDEDGDEDRDEGDRRLR